MHQQDHAIRLGTEDLVRGEHVCGLFQGAEELRAATIPLAVDGLRSGDRVVYLTEDPAPIRFAISQAAGQGGLDVDAEERAGNLEVRSWSDSYLAGGRFSDARMLGFLRSLLHERTAAGQRRMRLIGEMAWAQDHVPGVETLVAYERGVDAILGHLRSVVVCAYDVAEQNASRIAAVVAAHDSVFAGGRLQRSSHVARPSTPRDRILTAAIGLFGEAGVRATRVDHLVEAAGIAKATFYRHFRSKDEAIVAWLKDERTRWFDGVRGRAEAVATSPIDVVPRFFEAVGDWLEAGDYRGCPYLNTSVELRDPAHPAVETIRSYLREIERFLGELAAAAGAREPDRVGTELQALVAGAITLGVAHRSRAFAVAAGEAAVAIVRDAIGPPDDRRVGTEP